MFLKRHEDQRNERLAAKEFQTRRVDRAFLQFKQLIRRQRLRPRTSANQLMGAYQSLGPILVYSHYLERILTEAHRRLPRKHNARLNRLTKQNSLFRDTLIQRVDRLYECYEHAIRRQHRRFPFIQYALPQEFHQPLAKRVAKQRARFHVMIAKKDETTVLTGAPARTFLRQHRFARKNAIAAKAVTGFPAYQGLVTAKCIVIHRAADWNKVSPGRIIVTHMTVPQHVPYLRRSVGLVTDEGGINSHAAITAREFKIPCIVGTKIATQVFKNGDLVKVDAIKGIVRKI